MSELPNSVTKESLEDLIAKSEVVYTNPVGTLTHCVITLPCGYGVTGESACVDPAKYDKAIGEKYALEQAVDKLWPLEGYLLANDRYRASAVDTYLGRMHKEQGQLKDRLDKLSVFLDKPQPSFIAGDEWVLLKQQKRYMKEYLDVLSIRVANAEAISD